MTSFRFLLSKRLTAVLEQDITVITVAQYLTSLFC